MVPRNADILIRGVVDWKKNGHSRRIFQTDCEVWNRGIMRLSVLILMFLVLTVPACSKQEGPEEKAGGIQTSTEGAKQAIRGYGKAPVAEARRTQSLGEDRTKGIDEATRNMDSR